MIVMKRRTTVDASNMAGKFFALVVCLSTLSLSLAGKVSLMAAKKSPHAGESSAILLQSYHWLSCKYESPNWYEILLGKVDDVAELGVSHVWFAPPSNAGSCEGYLPRQLSNFTSNYGTEEQLKKVIKAFKKKNIESISDIVVNHRVGTWDWADFTEPEWPTTFICNDDEWPKPEKSKNKDTGAGFDGGRDIDHSSEEVQQAIIEWLNKDIKKKMGFSGLRWDFVKGFKAEFVGKYVKAFDTKGLLCVGELWTDADMHNLDAHRQKLVDWVDGTDKTCSAFDFTTKAILNDATENGNHWRLKDRDGKPAGMIGWWPAMSVTFVDNHDTGPAETCNSDQNLWPCRCDRVPEAYAYILTHPGIPTLYWPHIYDWNMRQELAELIKIRKEAGITSTSPVEIKAAEQELYAAHIIGKSKTVAMKIGQKDWSPGNDCKVSASGKNYAVWIL